MKIRTTQLLAAAAALAFTAGTASAATVFSGLTATDSNDANNGASFGAGGLAALTDDAFLYDINSPNSPLPDQAAFNGGLEVIFQGAHTNGEAITIDFNIDNHTIVAGEEIVVFDLYGRNHSETDAGRDNDITITVLDDLGGTLGTISSIAIPDPDSVPYIRASFTANVGDVIGGFVIAGGDGDGNGAANYFALAEVRAGAVSVPEPGSVALLGLGGLLIARRRRG